MSNMKDIDKILGKMHFKCKYYEKIMERNDTFLWKHVCLKLLEVSSSCNAITSLSCSLREKSRLPIFCKYGEHYSRNNIFSWKHVSLQLLEVSPSCNGDYAITSLSCSLREKSSLFIFHKCALTNYKFNRQTHDYKPASSLTFFIVFCISSSTLFIDRLY